MRGQHEGLELRRSAKNVIRLTFPLRASGGCGDQSIRSDRALGRVGPDTGISVSRWVYCPGCGGGHEISACLLKSLWRAGEGQNRLLERATHSLLHR